MEKYGMDTGVVYEQPPMEKLPHRGTETGVTSNYGANLDQEATNTVRTLKDRETASDSFEPMEEEGYY